MRLLWVACALAGCEGSARPVCQEPAQLTASASPPFQPLLDLPAMPVGGTLAVPLRCDTVLVRDCDRHCPAAPFDLPYTVDVRDGLVSFTGVDRDGAATFRGERAGMGHIAFIGPGGSPLYGEVAVRAAELDHVTLTRVLTEKEPTDLEIALSSQQGLSLGVSLRDATDQPLQDSSLVMELPTGASGHGSGIELTGLATGSYTLGFRSSGRRFTKSVDIVNEADTIELWSAPATIPRKPIVPGAQEFVCFLAKSAGRYISGLRWQHATDGVPAELGYSEGCDVAATDRPSGEPVTFTASAGGKSLTVQIPAR
jgi:hypothetical protein